MRQNIFAYTPPISAPPYLSINEDEDGVIRLVVRGYEDPETHVAWHATINMPVNELLKMAAAVNTHCFPLQTRQPR